MKAGRVPAVVIGGAGIVYVVALLGVALARLFYPYELEWMGGAVVDQVARVVAGEPLYAAPSPDYVPFLYGPMYLWVSAGFSRVLGDGFLPLRLVSLTATCGTLVLIYSHLWFRTRDRLAGVLGVALYAACYFVLDTWYDIERVDSLFVFLVAAALVLLDCGRGRESAALAGVLMAAAYLTKQTSLVFVLPFAVSLGFVSWRRAPIFLLVFIVCLAATVAGLDARSSGWFSFYTWTQPRQHDYILTPLRDIWWIDLQALWPAMGVLLWMFVERFRRGDWRLACRDGAWGMGLVLGAVASRMHVGGATNVLMPLVLAVALLAGLALGAARAGVEPSGRRSSFQRWVPWLLVAQCLLLAIDFGDSNRRHAPRMLAPWDYVPTAADRAAWDQLVEILREADGEVVMPMHGYWPRALGSRTTAHAMAIFDVIRTADDEDRQQLIDGYLDLARSRQAAIVVLDDSIQGLGRMVDPGYVEVERIVPADDDAMMPIVRMRARPVRVFRRVD